MNDKKILIALIIILILFVFLLIIDVVHLNNLINQYETDILNNYIKNIELSKENDKLRNNCHIKTDIVTKILNKFQFTID